MNYMENKEYKMHYRLSTIFKLEYSENVILSEIELKQSVNAYKNQQTILYEPWNKGKTGLQVGWNKGLKLKPMSEEQKEKLRLANIGKVLTEEHKKKIGIKNSISRKGCTPWNKGKETEKTPISYSITFPDGRVETIFGMKEFCEKYNLSRALMSKVCTGKLKHHRGYIAQKLGIK